ncbi:MAG: MazG family protein [Elusimicrobia bacterium]|nr:MazG family protein [Elusimicrobiota bacterium]
MKKRKNQLEELIALCAKLRSQDGCMWDREQTHESLISCLEEEAGEVADAIRNKDTENLKEELGDLLYQVVFHSQLASERGDFDLRDVIEGICEKLIRRHPHVFSDTKVNSIEDILKNWSRIKKEEKKKT